MEKINNTENRDNPQAEAWGELADLDAKKGHYIETPDGKRIHESEYDAYMEAKEREDYYKSHPESRDMEKLYDRLEEMDNNPDRLDNFEGEHIRGPRNRTAEYSSSTGMYAAAPDGSKLNNATRKEMARMMHDAEDFQTFEEDGNYKDYIERERAKIGSVYKNRDDFNHKIVARLKKFEQNRKTAPEDSGSKDDVQMAEMASDESGKQVESTPDETIQLPELPDSQFYPPAALQQSVEAEFQPPVPVEGGDEDTATEQSDEAKSEQENNQVLAKRAIDEIIQYGREEIAKLEDSYKMGDFSKKELRAKGEALVYYLWNRLDAVRNDYPGVDDRRLQQADEIVNNLLAKYQSTPEDDSVAPSIEKQPDVLALEDKQGNIIDGQGQIVDNDQTKGELADKSKEIDDQNKQERLEKSKEAIKEMLERAIAASKAAGNEHLKNAEAILERLKALDGDIERDNKKAEKAQEIEDLKEQIKEAKKELKQREENLAESYAKNRGLFVGSKNRTEYIGNKQKYGESLTKYLQLEAKLKYLEGDQKNGEQIQATYDKLKQDIKDGKISPEDAGKALSDKWIEISKKLQTDVSTQFVEQFIEENKNLENKTIDRIDNGNLYRKVVSKIIDNKALKVALGVAGAAALTATGIGVATGAVAATLSYTTGGILAGAARGALSGAIMSRQSSKNSAVRGFVNEDEIRQKLKSIDAVNNDQDVKNVTDWLMGQYDTANKADHSSNRKRTLISTTIGAIMGGAMSGVRLEKPVSEHESYNKIIGHEPTEKHAALVNEVDHAKGTGTQRLFRELGGDDNSYFSSGAHDMMQDVLSKYEMTPDVYTGKLADWPETARIAYTEVADEWAKHGLVDVIETGGGPIYDTYGYTVNNMVADGLRNFFTQAGTAATAGALGGAISRIRNRIRNPEPVPNVTPAAEPTSPLEQAPTQPDQAPLEQAPTQPDQAPDQTGNAAPADQSDQDANQTGNAAPAEDYDTATRNAFQGRVNDDVLNYMTSDSDYNGVDGNMMQFRLMDVPQDVRREIAEYMDSHSDEAHGRALRQVIDLMRQNGQI